MSEAKEVEKSTLYVIPDPDQESSIKQSPPQPDSIKLWKEDGELRLVKSCFEGKVDDLSHQAIDEG